MAGSRRESGEFYYLFLVRIRLVLLRAKQSAYMAERHFSVLVLDT